MANAAVPIEESIEDPVKNQADQRPEVRPLIKQRNSRRTPPLDIPATIEPRTIEPRTIEPRVTEDSVDVGRPVAQIKQNSGTNGNRGLANMFYQIQILQQEIQDLRGQLEQQGYLVKRLQQDQQNQYLDLDRRVAALDPAAALSSNPVTAQTGNVASTAVVGTSSGAVPLDDQGAYRHAFEAMREQRFDESKIAFQNLISDFPNSQYTPNAFYWIGEIFLAADKDAEQARQSFTQVVNLYPDHQKAPDALYKLGVVHATLGENDTARRFFERVQREHPDSSAAGLARKYVSEVP